jgi:hypothetical protein
MGSTHQLAAIYAISFVISSYLVIFPLICIQKSSLFLVHDLDLNLMELTKQQVSVSGSDSV